MTEQMHFDDDKALELLQPYFKYCREVYPEENIGDLEAINFMMIVTTAATNELKCDAQQDGYLATMNLKVGLEEVCKAIHTIKEDLSRDIEVRRAEVIAGLTPYQREILGLTAEEQ